ncbi:hypothetical protein AHAS_Ahas14G0152500 [Arachis hypogaea]
MAVGILTAASSGREYGGRITSFVIMSCMVAATGGIIFGYDIGISVRTFTTSSNGNIKEETKLLCWPI